MTSNEFYTQRDDRTDRCARASSYQLQSCALVVDEALATAFSGQIMAIAATDMLARWCRSVRVCVPDIPLCPQLSWLGKSLRATIEQRMQGADPFGRFVIRDCPTGSDLLLYLGGRVDSARPCQTVVHGHGWLAAVGRQSLLDPLHRPNPLAALFGAAIGVAQVFLDALDRDSPMSAGVILDAFSMRLSKGDLDQAASGYPESLNVGQLLCIGAGAVASSSLYAAALLGIEADVTCIDKDDLKVLNLARSPTATFARVGQAKVDALAQALQGSLVRVTPYSLWWSEFSRQYPSLIARHDLWLPLANERGVRHAIQAAAPPLMIHASTTSNWGVTFGRHIPGRDDCLAERFPETGSPSFTCATGRVEAAPETRIDAALPFLSLLAGVTVAADLVRLGLPNYPQVPNFAALDLGANQLVPMVFNRAAAPHCPHCRDNIAKGVRSATRYGNLY